MKSKINGDEGKKNFISINHNSITDDNDYNREKYTKASHDMTWYETSSSYQYHHKQLKTKKY